ncbi:MAG TPA: tetraacyldisaccharide 4'-kinase [Thermoanaerobaculia bacterium]|nr:tetraacyldisaccharide 4'-kinase [Thermoanaerobaculia bacterium]
MIELLYRGINRLRRALYRRGVLKAKRLPRPVISIGNIAAGGTGKTPAVIAVCRFLIERGIRPAVLTRGYGRRDPSAAGIVTDVNYGDEPFLIKRSCNCDVIVESSRYESAIEYLRKNDANVFILDDGFQHLQLHRDLDVVIDAPSRFHREGRAALRDADVVIPRRLRTIVPPELRGRRVFAFAGLADNAQFFASLEGLEVIGTRSFPDHHDYTAADLAALKREAGTATLVTTEKDAVKIDDPSVVAVRAVFDIDGDVLETIAAAATSPERRGRKRRKNALLQRIEYIAFRAVAHAVSSLSEEAIHRWGGRLGALARRVLRRRDRLAMRNLGIAFPGRDARELRRILDSCWRHFGWEMLLYLRMQNLSLEEIAERCPFINAHLLEEAIARGKGTVLISAHWGGWEVAGLALTSLVRNVRTVARPLDNELLERDLQRLRAKTGAEVVDRRRAARPLMKGLAENAVVVLLPDQAVQPREGVLVPFLGRPAWTTPAPAKMALRACSTIVFAFCIPDGLRHRLEFEEPIRVDLLTEDERDPVMLTKRINDILSRRISSRPDLWLWMHDRWKGTGESEVMHGV